ncbi:hypothetical protein H1C71_032998, partial [Ictidomys tridecemlineatus]
PEPTMCSLSWSQEPCACMERNTTLWFPIHQSVTSPTTYILGHYSHSHSPSHMVISTVGQWTGSGSSCLLQHCVPHCAITEQASQCYHTAHPPSPICESGCLHFGTPQLLYWVTSTATSAIFSWGRFHLGTPTEAWKPNTKVPTGLTLLLPPTRNVATSI